MSDLADSQDSATPNAPDNQAANSVDATWKEKFNVVFGLEDDSADGILQDLFVAGTAGDNLAIFMAHREKAKAQLKALILKSLPERYAKKRPYQGYGMIGLIMAKHEGFDQALDEVVEAIDRLFGGLERPSDEK